MDDLVASVIKTAIEGSALSTAISGKLQRSDAPQSWTAPYGVFHGLVAEPQSAKTRAGNGIDDTSMRFTFYTVSGPDSDKLTELCRILFDGLHLTLSDGSKIKLNRQKIWFAVRDEERPDTGYYRASIDFQYFRQY